MDYPIPYHPTWEVVDPSKLDDYIRCPRQYFYEHMLGWKGEAPNNHLEFGQAWHLAMEHLLLNGYGAESIWEAQQLLEQHYRQNFPEELDELFEPKTPDRAVLALVEYTKKYKNDFDNIEVLYTEIAGTVPISDSKVMFFRMDDILRHRKEGYYFSFEHKTRGGTYSNQWAIQWPLSTQIGTYIHSLYCLYPQDQVRGVMVNGAFFKKTKSPLFEFERIPVWKLPHQMQTWYETTSHWVRSLEEDTTLLSYENDRQNIMRSFPMRPVSCSDFFGCPFHDFCLAWPNPLQHCDVPPLGFKIDFWDPRDEGMRHQMEFKPLTMIEEMIKELERTNE